MNMLSRSFLNNLTVKLFLITGITKRQKCFILLFPLNNAICLQALEPRALEINCDSKNILKFTDMCQCAKCTVNMKSSQLATISQILNVSNCQPRNPYHDDVRPKRSISCLKKQCKYSEQGRSHCRRKCQVEKNLQFQRHCQKCKQGMLVALFMIENCLRIFRYLCTFANKIK